MQSLRPEVREIEAFSTHALVLRVFVTEAGLSCCISSLAHLVLLSLRSTLVLPEKRAPPFENETSSIALAAAHKSWPVTPSQSSSTSAVTPLKDYQLHPRYFPS
jgi:hypothetical protein